MCLLSVWDGCLLSSSFSFAASRARGFLRSRRLCAARLCAVSLRELRMSGRSGSRYPFTATQWQELEHQALIFKYMASGAPIPHDLILPIRRSFYLDSAPSSTQLFPHQPNVGWGCFQMGFGRKPEDPEPGRCRRTDGKKWRCSKEAYPDSKYCERHMHRGKNRSRKPVEISINTSSTVAAVPSGADSAASHVNPSPLYPSSHLSVGSTAEAHHLLYPFLATRHPGMGVPHQGSAHFQMDTASSSDRDFRYCHGAKEDADQYGGFFSEAPGGGREGPWRFTPLGTCSLGDLREKTSCTTALQQGGGLFLGAETLTQKVAEREEDRRQHCFVLGADFKLEKPAKEQRDGEAQRPLRHLFDDWPLKTKEPWMGSEEEEQRGWGGFPMTQLSISIPMGHNDFSTTAGSHRRNDD